MNTRDRRLVTLYRTSLTIGSNNPQKGLFDCCDAVGSESTGFSKGNDTSSAFYLNGEGTLKV